MIIDLNEYFMTTDDPPVDDLGGHASGYSDYFDSGEAESMDGHRKVYLNIEGTSDLTSDGADTETIILESDTAVGFATNVTTHYTSGALAKDAIAAVRTKVLLPEGMYRYFRIKWTISSVGTSSAGGHFHAYLSNS
jgi:hypothetical protein